jgi:hypothetical protein
VKIKLVQDVYGEDRFGNKIIRSTVRFSRRIAFEWRVGTIMEVSEASGRKMIEAGQAVELKDEPQAVASE